MPTNHESHTAPITFDSDRLSIQLLCIYTRGRPLGVTSWSHLCLVSWRYTFMWFLRSLMSFALVHLQAWKTSGGHILVKPLVDGQEVGFMILDTGALLCRSENYQIDI